jgi:two-component system OmpR family sensor kinase
VSFRVQIALYGTAVVGVALLVFSVLVYGLAAGALMMTQDRDLTQRGERLLGSLTVAGPDAFSPQHLFTASELSDSNDTFVELLDSSGNVLWTTGTLNGAPPLSGEALGAVASGTPKLATLDSLRIYVRQWSRPDLGRSGNLVVGQPVRGIQSTQAGIRGFLWLSGVFTFIAALIAIWLVAGRALRPLLQVASTAEDIRVTGDLRRRLPESPGWVELNRLAGAFNGMLQRLELAQERLASALEAQRRFVADASHELRTPLTTIQSNAGLLLHRPDVSYEDRQAALGDIASEAERMRRLIHDLLTLARADAGQRLELSVLDLGPVVAEVGRQATALYADRSVTVDCMRVEVVGNADALKQLQWILLDNAARLSGVGGHIALALQPGSDGSACLSVADDGPGVPPADRERIFDRFYQADLARSSGGAGLGLSIARWIVAEHHGTLRVEDTPTGHGAKFVAEFPAHAAHHASGQQV